MTLAIPAWRTAASNGTSCSLRSSRGPTCAGAWLRPPSARPWPTMCLAVASTPSARSGALERLDVGAAELRREVRVLAVGLLDPAPAGVARDVEHRRQRMPGTGQQHPPADGRGHRRHGVRVERRRRADRLLEARRGPGDEAVEALLVDDRRDPQPRLLDELALDRVGGLGHLDRAQVRRAGEARDVADPVGGQHGQPPGIEAVLADDLERPERARAGRPSRLASSGRAGPRRGRRAERPGSRYGAITVRHPLTEPAVRPPTSWRSATR